MLGALVIIVPTVRTLAEGTAARDWTMYPPLGKRSLGAAQAADPLIWGNVPGGYRNTINKNVVLIEMIETMEGAKDAPQIAAIHGRDGGLCRERRSGKFFRIQDGDAGLRAADQHCA